MVDRLVRAVERPERHTDIVVEIRIALVRGDRLADQVDGDIVAADLEGDNAQEVQAVDVLGINHEDIAINALRLRQPSGLVQRHRVLVALMEIEIHVQRPVLKLANVGACGDLMARRDCWA